MFGIYKHAIPLDRQFLLSPPLQLLHQLFRIESVQRGERVIRFGQGEVPEVREREKESERETERDREREKERDRERDREREREKDRERWGEGTDPTRLPMIVLDKLQFNKLQKRLLTMKS